MDEELKKYYKIIDPKQSFHRPITDTLENINRFMSNRNEDFEMIEVWMTDVEYEKLNHYEGI